MKGMILAAGFGTRLRPLTWTTPKPMVPLCNRPLVGWALESFIAAGVSEIVINLHHLPRQIEEYASAAAASRARLHFSLEDPILGTGGALRRVRPLLEGEETFFLVNGDTVQFPRFAELRALRQETDALAALTLRHPPRDDRFTAVWLDGRRVSGFGEGTGEPLMFAGSHAISGGVFASMPDRDVFGIVDRVYQPAIASGAAVAGLIDDGLWFDIGTPARYLGASTALLDAMRSGVLPPPAGSSIRGDSLVHATAHAATLPVRSTIGERSVVEGRVAGSIVWSDCSVARGARLERCIVGSGVKIPPGMELADAVVCLDDPAIPAEIPRSGGLVISG